MGRLVGMMKDIWLRSMMHRAMLVAPPIALILWAGYVSVGRRSGAQYFTAKVEQGDISQVVQATGTINPVNTVPFQNALAQAQADYQNSVANVTNLEAQIETTRANVATMKANIAKAHAASVDMETQLRRTKLLAEQGVL